MRSHPANLKQAAERSLVFTNSICIINANSCTLNRKRCVYIMNPKLHRIFVAGLGKSGVDANYVHIASSSTSI